MSPDHRPWMVVKASTSRRRIWSSSRASSPPKPTVPDEVRRPRLCECQNGTISQEQNEDHQDEESSFNTMVDFETGFFLGLIAVVLLDF